MNIDKFYTFFKIYVKFVLGGISLRKETFLCVTKIGRTMLMGTRDNEGFSDVVDACPS